MLLIISWTVALRYPACGSILLGISSLEFLLDIWRGGTGKANLRRHVSVVTFSHTSDNSRGPRTTSTKTASRKAAEDSSGTWRNAKCAGKSSRRGACAEQHLEVRA